jgi:hypothetical protein
MEHNMKRTDMKPPVSAHEQGLWAGRRQRCRMSPSGVQMRAWMPILAEGEEGRGRRE